MTWDAVVEAVAEKVVVTAVAVVAKVKQTGITIRTK